MLEELALGASVREFSYLALCAADGECETVYGVPVHAYKQKEFLEVLDAEEKKITSGLNEENALVYSHIIQRDEDYSSMIQVNGVHSHVYCSRLPETDWYLVSIMPYGTLDDAVRRLGGRRHQYLSGAGGIAEGAGVP